MAERLIVRRETIPGVSVLGKSFSAGGVVRSGRLDL